MRQLLLGMAVVGTLLAASAVAEAHPYGYGYGYGVSRVRVVSRAPAIRYGYGPARVGYSYHPRVANYRVYGVSPRYPVQRSVYHAYSPGYRSVYRSVYRAPTTVYRPIYQPAPYYRGGGIYLQRPGISIGIGF